MPKSKKSATSRAEALAKAGPHSALVPVRKDRTRYSEPAAEQINPLDGVMMEEAGQPQRTVGTDSTRSQTSRGDVRDAVESVPTTRQSDSGHQPSSLNLFYSAPGVWLYHNNCLEVLDAIALRYPEGRFDMIFADPPYFLSNGGITCHAGKMVSVHKGDWDQSRGPEWNHEFNTAWLARCQRVLKPNGTLWVTGTHHVIFSVGFALQQLGFKILNDIAWEKPNPPPNLSCRYFTHSTETILWAAKNAKSRHVFNYQDMRKVTGKQMKTVWRDVASSPPLNFNPNPNLNPSSLSPREERAGKEPERGVPHSHPSSLSPREERAGREPERGVPHSHPSSLSPREERAGREPERGVSQSAIRIPHSEIESSVWTMSAPGNGEKTHGKHPTQKPVALVERCLLASTNPGDLVLDPFLGGGTTAVACVRLGRGFVGVELDLTHLALATRRADAEIITLWLRHFRVRVVVSVIGRAGSPLPAELPGRQTRRATECAPYPPDKNDLDLFSNLIDRSAPMSDKPEPQAERIFHETKFVFLSCAVVSSASVVHTTVDISLTEAWAHAPIGKKRETTHIVRCETEIVKIQPG